MEEYAKPKEEREYVHEPEMIRKPKKRPPKVMRNQEMIMKTIDMLIIIKAETYAHHVYVDV